MNRPQKAGKPHKEKKNKEKQRQYWDFKVIRVIEVGQNALLAKQACMNSSFSLQHQFITVLYLVPDKWVYPVLRGHMIVYGENTVKFCSRTDLTDHKY